MTAAITVPPLKSQGIKTKLVPWINDLILTSGTDINARWIEPFFGTGVVGFNSPMRGAHIVGDTNPHIINFYRAVQSGEVTPHSMRAYLERESRLLTEADEHALFEALSHTRAKFILSPWHHNDYRANDRLDRYWNHFNVTTREHFYHGGGHIENRHAMVEALVFNFDITEKIEAEPARQLELFAEAV